MKKTVACFFGTRPEIIKLAPVIKALQNDSHFHTKLIATAQHREMLDEMLQIFNITPDVDLNCMLPDQTLAQLTAQLLIKVAPIFEKNHFDAVLVQGDTSTVMVVALICFYKNIPVGHVEAGLRSFDLRNPFPEELNRVMVSRLASWHFVPTEDERDILLREQVPEKIIHITGNTVIDTVKLIAEKDITLPFFIAPDKKLILVTAHRRESFGEPLENICTALAVLGEQFKDIEIIFPVHPNPKVQTTVQRILSGQPRIHLVEPLSYEKFVACMKQAYLIMSDSGGVQEEAPSLGKPVLILRDKTERPRTVSCGLGKLVGTDPQAIVAQATRLLTDPAFYAKTAVPVSPYGDGHAAQRIVKILREELAVSSQL